MVNPRRAWGRRNHRAGLAYEDAAARWYQAQGAQVLERRWRPKGTPEAGEIDLIVRAPDAVVFVEVKGGRGALARDVISAAQWARLEMAAVQYMVSAKLGAEPVRFDAAFVGPDGEVSVIENARTSEAW